MKVMSPTAPEQEVAGMKAADEFCAHRPWMNARHTRQIGEWGYSYYRIKGKEAFGDGFRRMCYIISQTRASTT